MKSEGNIQFSGTESQIGMISLREVASINEETINPKSLDWLNYTDIASVGTRTVEFPQTIIGQNAPSRARRVLRNGDTVLSTVRPNRKSYFQFKDNWDRAIASTGFAVVSPKNLQDADYLYAVLTSDASTLHYESLCEGGAYPAFNPRTIEEMQIPWPSQEERNVVGGLSASILKKIETNGQLARTLEDITQTIFKSWFVDFDPVKAKLAGEKPVGMDDATAALFPDSMEDSEAGQIPNGWTALTLGRIASISKSTISPQHHPEVEFKHYSIPDFDRQQYPSTTLGLNILSNKFLLTTSSVLLSKLNPETKRIWTVMRPESSSICSTEFVVLVPKNETFLPFVHALTRHPNFYGRFISLATGSTGSRQRVRPEEILSIAVVVPSPALLEKFAEMVRPCLEQQSVLCEEIQSLIDIRDALLPRLISGELQIPEEMLAS